VITAVRAGWDRLRRLGHEQAARLTFRARLILAATAAVICAVFLASAGAYVASRDALVNSVDATLKAAANQVHTAEGLNLGGTPGVSAQIVTADGTRSSPRDCP
jgi:hypothetical protein